METSRARLARIAADIAAQMSSKAAASGMIMSAQVRQESDEKAEFVVLAAELLGMNVVQTMQVDPGLLSQFVLAKMRLQERDRRLSQESSLPLAA